MEVGVEDFLFQKLQSLDPRKSSRLTRPRKMGHRAVLKLFSIVSLLPPLCWKASWGSVLRLVIIVSLI
jgi:hypothetical protein